MEPADRTVDRRTLESAAANHSYLRGLGAVPLGLVFVVMALAAWEVGPLRHIWAFLVAVLLLIVAPGLWINRYYDEHYGRFTPSSRRQGRHVVTIVVALAVGVPVLVALGLLLRSEEPWSLDLAVIPVAALWAVMMLGVSASTVGWRKHRVIILGAILVAALLPVWHGADPYPIGCLMIGVGFIAMGLFDHRLLARTYRSPADRGLEARDAGA
jgi:uncharacterized membrane protein